jgi:DNA-binding CsgD family transcriptional regulator
MNEQNKVGLTEKVRNLPFIASCKFAPKALEVLEMLLTGESEKQIAVLLHQKPGTTHDYVKQIYKQLGVSSRAELFAMVLRALVDQEAAADSPQRLPQFESAAARTNGAQSQPGMDSSPDATRRFDPI